MTPSPPDPRWPRWSAEPFPPYRYIPGHNPHPRRHPAGHSYGAPEPRVPRLDPAGYAGSGLYLLGVDLFNYAYWWESHEAFEALWRAARPGAEVAFFQGLIQLAASEIKRFAGAPEPARALLERASSRLAGVPSPFFGVDVKGLHAAATQRLAGTRELPPLITLDIPPRA